MTANVLPLMRRLRETPVETESAFFERVASLAHDVEKSDCEQITQAIFLAILCTSFGREPLMGLPFVSAFPRNCAHHFWCRVFELIYSAQRGYIWSVNASRLLDLAEKKLNALYDARLTLAPWDIEESAKMATAVAKTAEEFMHQRAS